MIELYAMNLANLPDPLECPQVMEGLEQRRKEKIAGCKQIDTRKQSLGAGLLLKHVLEIHDIQNPGIYFGMHGKPEVRGLCFNLSHSKDMVLCAVSDKAIGCDVEAISCAPQKVADRFLCDGEKEYLNNFSGEMREKAFCRFWTMKESYVKMTGEGLSPAPKSFEMKMEEELCVYRKGIRQDCHFQEYELPGYAVTVCAMEETFPKNPNMVMTNLTNMSIISIETFKGE